MRFPRSIAGALLSATALPVLAQEPARHFYLGVDAGQGRIHREHPDYYAESGRDSDSAAWKLRFGWQPSPHWSFEAGYTDFGRYDGRLLVAYRQLDPLLDPGSLILAAGDFTTSVKGFDISAIGRWPIGDTFYLDATLGMTRREMKSKRDPVMPGSPSFRAKDGDLAVQYGLGGGFRLGEAWELGLNWVTTSNLDGDFEFPENQSDPSLLSLGVRYRL